MRILVDGAIFAFTTGEECRFWTSLLSRLAKIDGLSVCLLDRGMAPVIAGIQGFEFPSLTSTYTAADSLLIQEFCDKLAVDVFSSTVSTTAITTPQVQLVYDMIPEVFGCDLSKRKWKERQLMLRYSSYYACICDNTRSELLRFYPEIDKSRVATISCAADPETFRFSASDGTRAFRETYGVRKPYFVLDGRSYFSEDCANRRLVFDAIKMDWAADYDIIVVGPKWTSNVVVSRELPPGVTVQQIDLSADELAAAYAGALAFIYPTRYEGFGMPILEAMASGCPVITTYQESLGTAAREAAVVVGGVDRYELLQALELVRQPDRRKRLIVAGRSLATTLSWEESTRTFVDLLHRSRAERNDDRVVEFHRRWKKARTIQSYVDIGVD